MAVLSRARHVGLLLSLAAVLLATASDAMTRFHAQGSLAATRDEIEPQWWGYFALAAFVMATGPLIERYGPKTVVRTSLVFVALACIACGAAPWIGVYQAGRFGQMTGTAIALTALLVWALPAFDARYWGLLLVAFSIIFKPIAVAVVFLQAYAADLSSWRLYPFAIALVAGLGATLAGWLANPGPDAGLSHRLTGVFDAESLPEMHPARSWDTPILACGLVASTLLAGLSVNIVPGPPPRFDFVFYVAAASLLATIAVGVLATRLWPAWIGAACCGVLLIGCIALLIPAVAVASVDTPFTYPAVASVVFAAQFAFALAMLRAAGRLALAASVLVASLPLTWSLWDLALAVGLIAPPGMAIGRDRLLAIGLAAIGVLAGVLAPGSPRATCRRHPSRFRTIGRSRMRVRQCRIRKPTR